MPTVTLVVPCYNESARLDVAALHRALDANEELHLLLVDDGSTDDTGALLRTIAGDRADRVEALLLDRNQGKAEAVRRGVCQALESAPDAFGYWDADLATPFEALPEFRQVLAEREACLLVMGARVQLMGRTIQRSAVRHYLGRVTATLTAYTLGVSVYDTQCGAKLFRRRPITESLFRDPFSTGWVFDVELLARLGNALADRSDPLLADTVVEVPLQRWIDEGDSRVRPLDFLKGFRDLWRIRARYGPGRRRRGGGV